VHCSLLRFVASRPTTPHSATLGFHLTVAMIMIVMIVVMTVILKLYIL